MRLRCHRCPRAAVALVCGCALVNLYLFQRDVWCRCATRGRSVPERFVAKYEPLRRLAPTAEVARFLIDERHADLELLHPGARLYLAQYAMSPRRLARGVASRWVIVDSDCPETVPEIAASARWTLLADLGNGVRLYRTDVRAFNKMKGLPRPEAAGTNGSPF